MLSFTFSIVANILQALPRLAVAITFTFSLALIQGCGGGGGGTSLATGTGSDGSSSAPETGEVIIGLTDAEGDFLTYRVVVNSIILTHRNGTEVETVPLATEVDFAQYTELTEFFTAAQIPTGVYTSARMTVDYSSAQIVVENAEGMGVDAMAVDIEGNAIDEMVVEVELVETDNFRIAHGIPAHVTLDFDLAASHEINFSDATVTVNPVFIADTLLEDPKEHRVRGLLDVVAPDENAFTVSVRPFHRDTGDFGTIRVFVTAETSYEIDELSYMGEEGLLALAEQETGTRIIAQGAFNRDAGRFEAEFVVAGSSVPWSDRDFARGNIIARSGDTLTLLGATVGRRDQRPSFHDTITVIVGPDTVVTRQAVTDDALDKDDISVGQRVVVMGEYSVTDPAGMILDASAGRVQLRYTNLSGEIVSALPLVVDLQSIDRRRISLFDFSGTGSSEDADPTMYEIDTLSLDTDRFAENDPVKVRGFVNRFGEAPPDFTARSIAVVDDVLAKMKISWLEDGTTAPFASSSAEGLVINLANPDLNAALVTRLGVVTNLLDAGVDPTYAPRDAESGLYVIAQRGAIQVFNNFPLFEAELAEELDGVTSMKVITGKGQFDDASATLTTNRITAVINEPLTSDQ